MQNSSDFTKMVYRGVARNLLRGTKEGAWGITIIILCHVHKVIAAPI